MSKAGALLLNIYLSVGNLNEIVIVIVIVNSIHDHSNHSEIQYMYRMSWELESPLGKRLCSCSASVAPLASLLTSRVYGTVQ